MEKEEVIKMVGTAELSIQVSPQMGTIPFGVTVNGRLYDYITQVGIGNQDVEIWMLKEPSETWTVIGTVKTGGDGSYSFKYTLASFGEYWFCSWWFGNASYPGGATGDVIQVIAYGQQVQLTFRTDPDLADVLVEVTGAFYGATGTKPLYSPNSLSVLQGNKYTVKLIDTNFRRGEYQYIFSHWEDDSPETQREVTPTTNMVMAAHYDAKLVGAPWYEKIPWYVWLIGGIVGVAAIAIAIQAKPPVIVVSPERREKE